MAGALFIPGLYKNIRMKILLIYLTVINIAAFAAYGIDKNKAEKHKWRIPEAALLLLAAIGGTIGALAGMLVFHHKTNKPKFVIGLPVILLLQAAALTATLYAFKI